MRSEVSSGKQGGICFDEFSKVLGLKLCFHLRGLMYSADKEGMYLWEEAAEEDTLVKVPGKIFTQEFKFTMRNVMSRELGYFFWDGHHHCFSHKLIYKGR